MKIINHTISFIDYPSNSEWAIILYFSGCEHKCHLCHNQLLQNPNSGKDIDIEDLYKLIKNQCEKNHTKNVVFSGGDPLYKTNINILRLFLEKYGNEFNICIYTGYDIEYVKRNNISNFKYIKCGVYNEKQKQPSGNFENYFQLASINQNFYNNKYEQVSKDGRLVYENSVKD